MPRAVKARLLLLLADASGPADWQATCSLVRRAQDVFRWSSDALHGRVSMLNLPQVVIEEWRDVVEDVERRPRPRVDVDRVFMPGLAPRA